MVKRKFKDAFGALLGVFSYTPGISVLAELYARRPMPGVFYLRRVKWIHIVLF